jgi:hypothetical protein
MALTYTEYATQLAALGVYESASDPDFVGILPSVVDYAENRIYRDLDLLATIYRDSSKATTPLDREFVLPTAAVTFMTVQSINIVVPKDLTVPNLGTRISLDNVSRDWIDITWPSMIGAGIPQTFAPLDDRTMLFGPWPAAAYQVEVIGTARPAKLSEANPSTFISRVLPDLLLAASMVFLSGFQRNFGAQAEDPATAMSWEAQYSKLVVGAAGEEQRRKYLGAVSTAYSEDKA